MATPAELTNDGLMFAYFNNMKKQRELRAEQKELEEEIGRRLSTMQDRFKRGDLEIKQMGVPSDGYTATESERDRVQSTVNQENS